jgi:hypothetical protein
LQAPAAAAGPNEAQATVETRIHEAAAALKELNPDIILLQQVRDWQMCAQLVQTLKPASYSVLVCSAFRDVRSGASSSEQVAILSKQKGYFSWSESWRPKGEPMFNGGFAFAAVQLGKQRVGFFSVLLPEALSPAAGGGDRTAAARTSAAYARQWLGAVDSFKNWVTNRVGTVVMAGGFGSVAGGPKPGEDPSARLRKAASFVNGFLGAPLEQPLAFSRLREQSGAAGEHAAVHLTASLETLPGIILNQFPATCDVDIGPAELAAAPAVRGEKSGGRPAETADTANPENSRLATPPPAIQTAGAQPKEPTRTAGESKSEAPNTTPNEQDSRAHSWFPTATLALLPWMAAVPGMLALLGVIWMLTRRRGERLSARPVLLAEQVESSRGTGSSCTVVITPGLFNGAPADAPRPPAPPRPAFHIDVPGTTLTQSEAWPRRPASPSPRPGREVPRRNAWLMLHLSQWLKQKLVQKLLRDRAQLLQTQQAATLKMMNVDERLARVELQLRQQNQAYERRIEELNRELLAAKEENREFIRGRIAQVKAEMESARARIMAQGEDGR